MRLPLILALAALPVPAFAVGSEDAAAPVPSETTRTCTAGQLWDTAQGVCIDPEADGIDNDARFAAVRELAYAGKADEAMRVLDAMTEGDSDRMMAYRGFVLRKAGRLEAALVAYGDALAQNPDNLLARSYLGLALVEMGEIALAADQLAEIRARGGAGSRAEAALAHAVGTGESVNY